MGRLHAHAPDEGAGTVVRRRPLAVSAFAGDARSLGVGVLASRIFRVFDSRLDQLDFQFAFNPEESHVAKLGEGSTKYLARRLAPNRALEVGSGA
jgi:hypothetical protein